MNLEVSFELRIPAMGYPWISELWRRVCLWRGWYVIGVQELDNGFVESIESPSCYDE